MMPDADGFKTGSLRQARWNHSATAERDGRRVITVVMNTSSRMARQNESRRLLNFGFEELERLEKERAEKVRVFYDGGVIPLSSAPSFFHGRLLLPVQDIFEHLGYSINWNEQYKLVSITHENGYTATLMTDRDLAVINGDTHTLPMPAQVINDNIYTSIESIGLLTGTISEWSIETGVVRFRK